MAKKAIFDKKNILIAGGAGFIGSYLSDELVKENKVIILDNFLTGREENISQLFQNPDFALVRQDVAESFKLESQPGLEKFKLKFQGLQEIYYLASPTSPKAYLNHPLKTLAANSLGLKNCLDLAVESKAKFLYLSSAAVYGSPTSQQPIKENFLGQVDQLAERSCYAEGQRFGEALVNSYRIKHNLDAKIIRVSNCYGPRMDWEDGRMIPELITTALSGRPPIVYGEKGDLGCYFYISDLIKALIEMMAGPAAGPFNVGSPWQTTFGEIAEKVVQLAGSKKKPKYRKRDQSMILQPVLDIRAIKKELGWFPVVLLEKGLEQTIEYFKGQQDVLRPKI